MPVRTTLNPGRRPSVAGNGVKLAVQVWAAPPPRARLDLEELRLGSIRKLAHLVRRDLEERRQRAARHLVQAQPEEAQRRGIGDEHDARDVALDLRQRRALEERLQPFGPLVRALHRDAAHRDAMDELAVLALELLVQHAGEREQVVALDLHLEALLQVAVQLPRVVHDREAEEERHHARVPVHSALHEEEIDRGRHRRGHRQRLVRALHGRVCRDRSGDEADDHHQREELQVERAFGKEQRAEHAPLHAGEEVGGDHEPPPRLGVGIDAAAAVGDDAGGAEEGDRGRPEEPHRAAADVADLDQDAEGEERPEVRERRRGGREPIQLVDLQRPQSGRGPSPARRQVALPLVVVGHGPRRAMRHR